MLILTSLTGFWVNNYHRATCFILELLPRFSATCRADMLSMYTGTLSKNLQNPSSFKMFDQNTASYIARVAATKFASILKLTRKSKHMTM